MDFEEPFPVAVIVGQNRSLDLHEGLSGSEVATELSPASYVAVPVVDEGIRSLGETDGVDLVAVQVDWLGQSDEGDIMGI